MDRRDPTEPIRLWHDDVRPPPDDTWTWAKTNAEAAVALEFEDVAEASLDHDMGCAPEDGLFARGSSEHDGVELVRWMIDEGHVPKRVTIHSWNQAGAARMADELDEHCSDLHVVPFEMPRA